MYTMAEDEVAIGLDSEVIVGVRLGDSDPVSVAVTGQMVVEISIIIVVTPVDRAGQLVTVGAQDVIVLIMVERIVEVV